MTMRTYADAFTTRVTPQLEPIPGETQVQNAAGGYVYALDPWAGFLRFLILGSDGGTFYAGARELTIANAKNALVCIQADGKRAVDLIVDVSNKGRAPKNDPAIFALALAAAAKDPDTRSYALAALPGVCRIPTHLFHFVTYVKTQRGLGRQLRRALGNWYQRFTPDQLAYELVKYQQRDGVSNRDVLRLAHVPMGNTPLARWAVGLKGEAAEAARVVTDQKKGQTPVTRHYQGVDDSSLPAIIYAVEQAKTATPTRLVKLILNHGLTREMLPTEALTHAAVWEALLVKMPITALLRNLGNMSKVGLLTPLSDAEREVKRRLRDQEGYVKGRVHPVQVLVALKTYAAGRGLKGSGEWTSVPSVVEALDDGYYLAFGAVQPTGKRLLFGLDVSGSMSSQISGLPLSCAEAAAVMAMVSARVEQDYFIMGFDQGIRDLGVSAKMPLADVLRRTSNINGGGTDCSLPMQWAAQQQVRVDGFIVLTDNETWAGHIHPSQALQAYRRQMGVAARSVVMGMTATNFSIADPNDPLSLDVVGFDTATPSALSEFLRG